MKVLVAEKIGDSGVRLLEDAGLEVELGAGWEDGELERRIGEFDGILIRSATQLDADLLERAKTAGVPINPQSATYFFNREMIISGGNARMWEWQKNLYGVLSRNARPAKDYYQITPSQISEIGLPLQL